MDAAFVVEGGPDAGLGHVYHSTALANGLESCVTLVFVTESGAKTRKKIRDHGYDVHPVEDQTYADVLDARSPDIVVFDLPWLERDELESVSNRLGTDTRLVAIGNRNKNLPEDIERYCDVVVDFDIGESERPSGRFYDERTQTLNLVGLRYFVLRSDFYNLQRSGETDNKLTQVLLVFGAADPSNFTSTALVELLKSDPEYEIDIVLGAGFSHEGAVKSVLNAHPEYRDCISVAWDVENIACYMLNADVVVTSPGLTMMEALLLGRPVVAFAQNELQDIWTCYPFVHDPECFDELPSLLTRANVSFDEMTEGMHLNFEKGKRQVLNAIRGNWE